MNEIKDILKNLITLENLKNMSASQIIDEIASSQYNDSNRHLSAGFSSYNVIKISEMIKSEKPVLLESNYDYFRYRRMQSEFIKYGLKVEFIT